jgi:Ca-activated chloride channel family protein
MKALVPYALLGVIGVGGTVAGSFAVSPSSGAQPIVPITKDANGAVIVRAQLERDKLPTHGAETFVRVALEGKRPEVTDQKRLPVALTLLIDRSGSMSGPKMIDAKNAAVAAIEALQPGDVVSVVAFDSMPQDLGSATIASGSSELRALLDAVKAINAGGGTNMRDGISLATSASARILKPGAINRMLLLSDGQPDTADGLREQIATLAKSGVATTTLGLGADYNEDLMASLADAGLGHYYFIEKPEQLAGIFGEELKSLATVVAREALVDLAPLAGTEILDVIGFDERMENGHALIPAGDVYGGRTTDILVRVRVAPHAVTSSEKLVDARVSYSDVAQQKRIEETRTLAAAFVANEQESLASLVPDVAVKAEKWRTADAYARANEAFNRGDAADGNRIIAAQTARLEAQSESLGSAELKEEAKQMQVMQKDNDAAGEARRGAMSKALKKKAWSLNKGTGY